MKQRARREKAELTLGIDLGGTKILAGVVNGEGKVLGRGKRKTPFAAGNDELGRALLETADAALRECGRERRHVGAVAVAAPGPIDPDSGTLLRANNLSARGFRVADVFSPALPSASAARIENDVRLAALAEARLGAGRDVKSLVAMWVGTGLGGAVVLDGKLWTGRNRNAGEIGQCYVDMKKARPGKPAGNLESVAAKVGMTEWLKRRIGRGEKTSLKKAVSGKGRLSSSDLKDALDGEDELARRVVSRSAKAVGLMMANLFNVLSPDLFVLGGGVGVDLGESYLAEAKGWATAFAFTQELGTLEVAPAALGDDAGILGAAIYARETDSGGFRHPSAARQTD